MGQLKQSRLAQQGMVEVCPELEALPLKPKKSSGSSEESLAQRLSRLDSELGNARADVGARGEPGHIELTSLRTNVAEHDQRHCPDVTAPWPLEYQDARWVNFHSQWDGGKKKPAFSLQVQLGPGLKSIKRDKIGCDWFVAVSAWGRGGRCLFERRLNRALTGGEAKAKHPPEDYVSFFTGCRLEAAGRLHLDYETFSVEYQ